jgi:hypothetical protein
MAGKCLSRNQDDERLIDPKCVVRRLGTGFVPT